MQRDELLSTLLSAVDRDYGGFIDAGAGIYLKVPDVGVHVF